MKQKRPHFLQAHPTPSMSWAGTRAEELALFAPPWWERVEWNGGRIGNGSMWIFSLLFLFSPGKGK